jgi:predicted nucleic acid-binding protein
MTQYFLDSSAPVKRYVSETGTQWVQSLHDPRAGHTRWIARITAAECIAALFRRVRMGQLSLLDAQQISARFRADIVADYRIVDITAAVIDRAMDLAEQFGLRGYDAVQLAAADLVNQQFLASGGSPITFVSADVDLNTAAQSLGLLVENPNAH